MSKEKKHLDTSRNDSKPITLEKPAKLGGLCLFLPLQEKKQMMHWRLKWKQKTTYCRRRRLKTNTGLRICSLSRKRWEGGYFSYPDLSGGTKTHERQQSETCQLLLLFVISDFYILFKLTFSRQRHIITWAVEKKKNNASRTVSASRSSTSYRS